jgi:hypothetical protein
MESEDQLLFYSKTLNKPQRNWPAYDKELFAIMQATKQWRAYLYRRRFTIYTDHMPLKYLHNKNQRICTGGRALVPA